PGPERDALEAWVRKGGLLIRFAGPRTAEAASNDTDTLMPVHLLAGDRQLGGAMSWSQPAGLAPFPPSSPLSALFVDILRRLVDLSVGVASAQSTAMLAPAETLDGFGLLGQPPPAAS